MDKSRLRERWVGKLSQPEKLGELADIVIQREKEIMINVQQKGKQLSKLLSRNSKSKHRL